MPLITKRAVSPYTLSPASRNVLLRCSSRVSSASEALCSISLLAGSAVCAAELRIFFHSSISLFATAEPLIESTLSEPASCVKSRTNCSKPRLKDADLRCKPDHTDVGFRSINRTRLHCTFHHFLQFHSRFLVNPDQKLSIESAAPGEMQVLRPVASTCLEYSIEHLVDLNERS